MASLVQTELAHAERGVATKGAVVVGKGVDWDVLPGPASGNFMLVTDPSQGSGLRWSSATARKLLATALAAQAIPGMAAPPAVTIGASGGNSTLGALANVFAPSILPNNAAITPICGPLANNANGLGAAYWGFYGAALGPGVTLKPGGDGCGVSFGFDGQAFDIAFLQGRGLRIKVNGEWAPESYPFGGSANTAGDFSTRYTLFDFGTRARRNIEVYIGSGDVLLGFNMGTNDRMWKWSPSDITGLAFGDSMVNTGGTTFGTKDGLAAKIGEALGIVDMSTSGISGQGWVQTDGTTLHNHLDRVNAGDLTRQGSKDILLLFSSVNDSAAATATITANVAAALTVAKAALPNALIFGIGCFTASGAVVDAAHNNAFLAGFNAAKDSTRMLAIDGFAAPSYISLAGNNTFYEDSDTIHPKSPDGMAYLAQRISSDIINQLKLWAA